MKPTTKQILNFIHNTLGITKEEFRQVALDAAKAEAEKEARRLLQQDRTLLEATIKMGIENVFKYNTHQFSESYLSSIIADEVARAIKVEIRQKDESTGKKGLTITFG